MEHFKMNVSRPLTSRAGFRIANSLGVVLMAFCLLALVGCFSSTKVYQTDKTITYNGALYNMSNVHGLRENCPMVTSGI